jgi:hypothetical protein
VPSIIPTVHGSEWVTISTSDEAAVIAAFKNPVVSAVDNPDVSADFSTVAAATGKTQ